MTKKAFLIVLIFNLFIAGSFFIMNYGVGYSRLSSDQQNIVPMCQKLDNPDLFQNDLFLSSVENFKYYTPFFVQPLRFMAKLTKGDYMLAINILHTFTHILYGLSWFFLFYFVFKKNVWVAFLLSILIRGLVWLPGMELWGISDLWTFMPRTVYSALAPIPFIVLCLNKRYSLIISALLIGFLFNFHPITGLGGILIYIYCILVLHKRTFYTHSLFKNIIISAFCILVGMLPFIYTYFSKTALQSNYDLNLYQSAFDARIPSYFKSMMSFAAKWMTAKILFFLLPILTLAILSIFYKKLQQWSSFIIGLTLVLFFIPLLSIPIENWINSTFDLNLRMSFQLVRIQKLSILPGYLAIGCLLIWLLNKQYLSQKILVGITILYVLILITATPGRFNPIPFISDDITTGIYCNRPIFLAVEEKQLDFDKMATYIKNETPRDAVFFRTYQLRSAALRSVKFDHKGASILIEGNPEKLIDWHHANQQLKNLSGLEKQIFLKNNGVTHILSKENLKNYTLIKQIGILKLYLIN